MTTVSPPGSEPCAAHLSDAEIRKAFQALTDGEKTAIIKIARVYAIRTPYGSTELYHEAICRLLEGTRTWPRNLSATLVFAGVMRSIAWEWRRRVQSPDADPDSLASSSNPEWAVLLKDLIMAFDDAPLLQQIFIERLKGAKGPELREWIARLLQQKGMAGGLDAPEIDSILRAIRRRVEKFRGAGE
jgi:hypothetical protein